MVVPEVLGLPQAEAEEALIAAGLEIGTITERDQPGAGRDSHSTGSGIWGLRLTKDRSVNLVLSSGPSGGSVQLFVPSVVDQTEDKGPRDY